MLPNDRRIGVRVPVELFLNQYVQDKPFRSLTSNISESGVYLNMVKGAPFCRDSRVVGLELELPGTSETIWARGEVCYDAIDSYFHGAGVKFTDMPRLHARLLRDYCIEQRRERLSHLLDRIRQPATARA